MSTNQTNSSSTTNVTWANVTTFVTNFTTTIVGSNTTATPSNEAFTNLTSTSAGTSVTPMNVTGAPTGASTSTSFVSNATSAASNSTTTTTDSLVTTLANITTTTIAALTSSSSALSSSSSSSPQASTTPIVTGTTIPTVTTTRAPVIGPVFYLSADPLVAKPPFGNDMELGTIMFIISVVICGLGFIAGFAMYYKQNAVQSSRDDERVVRGKARRAASLDGSFGGNEDYLMGSVQPVEGHHHHHPQQHVGNNSLPNNVTFGDQIAFGGDGSTVAQFAGRYDPYDHPPPQYDEGEGEAMPLPHQPPPRDQLYSPTNNNANAAMDDDLLGSPNAGTALQQHNVGGLDSSLLLGLAPPGRDPMISTTGRNSMEDELGLGGAGAEWTAAVRIPRRPLLEEDSIL